MKVTYNVVKHKVKVSIAVLNSIERRPEKNGTDLCDTVTEFHQLSHRELKAGNYVDSLYHVEA